MNITIIAVGSRGDVQPYIALSLGLEAAGHHVRLATHKIFESFVEDHGLEFAPLEGDPRTTLASDTGQKWQKSSRNPLAFLKQMRAVAIPILHQLTMDCYNAMDGADVALFSVLGALPAYSAARKRRVQMMAAYLQPSTPTTTFPCYRFPDLPASLAAARGVYNPGTQILMDQLFWTFVRDGINGARVNGLDMQPLSWRSPLRRMQEHHVPHIYAYSRHVIPPPPDWDKWNAVTGFWFLDRPANWQPSADLAQFLEAGPPPVYVGFGSMNNRDPETVTKLVLESLKATGQRGVILTGWGGLTQVDLPDTVFKVDEVPHDWLFPQMAAVVHHGGSGTTAAGLRAGVPSVLVPFFADQPLWGRRVKALGVGPTPVPHKHITAEALSQAIHQAVTDSQMQERAAALSEKIRAENGVAHAVEAIERYARIRGRIPTLAPPALV